MVLKKIISQRRTMSLAFTAVWTLSLLSAPHATAAAIQDTIVDVTDSVRINFPMGNAPFYMDISTNMLYDLALTPNISVEFYLGRRWSVAADWKYAWWSKESSNFYWRNYGGDLVIRKWLGRKSKEKPLQGHHLGVYGKMFLYDYQLGGTGRISGKYTYSEYVGDNDQSWNYSVGIEYGYSLPMARRLNIDFAVGVGYAGGNTNSYEPDSGHHYSKSSKKVNYVGPTRADISLVWLLGHGNYNADKGRSK